MLGLISGEIYITRLVKDLPLNQVLMSAAMVGLILALAIFFVVRDSPSTQKQQGRLIPFPVFLKQVFLVLRSPYTWIIGLMGACLYTSLSIFGELWGKSFLEISFHLSKEQAAQSMAYMFLGWAVGAPLSGFCSDRSRQRLHPIIVCTMGALICFCLILYASQLSYTGLNLCLFGYGLFSSIEITVFIMANEYSKVPHLSGTTFSAVNMIVSFMGMIFQPLVGALLDWSSPYGYVHHYSLGNYRVGLSVVVVALLTVLVISISLLFHPSRAKNSN